MFNKAVKRGWVLLLALMMVVTMSIPAFADTPANPANPGDSGNQPVTEPVKKNVTTQAELQAAVNDGGTVTLMNNIAITGELTVPSGKNVTLNFNGKTLSFDAAGSVANSGILTMQGFGYLNGKVNNNVGGTLNVNNISGIASLTNAGTATLSSSTVNDIVSNTGNLTISSGSFNGVVSNSGTMNINGGYLQGLTNQSSGRMTIAAGTVNGSIDNAGRLSISNGSFSSNAPIFTNQGTELNISGGTFRGTLLPGNTTAANSTRITGGNFSDSNVRSMISNNYEVAYKNSMFTVITKGANYWITELTCQDVYFGQSPKPYANSRYGTVYYVYFDNFGRQLYTVPSQVGTYYVQARVDAGSLGNIQSWGALMSNRKQFRILPSRTNNITKKLTMSDWTYGTTPTKPEMTTQYGTPTFTYYDANKKPMTSKPVLPGKYYVQGTVKASANYDAATSGMVAFNVRRPKMILQATRKGRTKANVKWVPVAGADEYVVYFSRCGSSFRRVKTTSNPYMTKNYLKPGRNYKLRVKAYKIVNGKPVYLTKSNVAHVIGNGYNAYNTNTKRITADQGDFSLSVGSSEQVTARRSKYKRGRYLLDHAAKFRFASSDSTVATVNKYGWVTGENKGTATIYIYANNGVWTTNTVTVY